MYFLLYTQARASFIPMLTAQWCMKPNFPMLPLLVNDSEILTWGRKTTGISQGGTFSRTLLIHSSLINQHTINIKMTSLMFYCRLFS